MSFHKPRDHGAGPHNGQSGNRESGSTRCGARMSARAGDVCVGADVGGTWIRIAVWTGTARVPTVVVPTNRDLRELVTVLRDVWRRRRWTRRRVAALVVASRGLWPPGERQAPAHRLRGLARRVHVVPDAQAALLGALGRQPGMLILSGTARSSSAGTRAGAGHGRAVWGLSSVTRAPDSGLAASGSARPRATVYRPRSGWSTPPIRSGRSRPSPRPCSRAPDAATGGPPAS